MQSHSIKICDWNSCEAQLSDMRRAVFINDQKVPEELEWDEFDSSCTHFLVKENNIPVATGRLKADGQIGRMAVIETHRRLGIGSQLLDYILEHAKESGHAEVFCHAQVAVEGFYTMKGFTRIGEIFIDANIPHQAMFKKICY